MGGKEHSYPSLLLLSDHELPRIDVMSDIRLTETNKGQTIIVHPGDQIIISLGGTPTAGYLWAVDAMDSAVLSSPTIDFSSPTYSTIGSAGKQNLKFEAKELGMTHLRLKHWREWLGDSSVTDRYDVTIHVQSG